MIPYNIRRVGLVSAAKFGLVLGFLAGLGPACLCGLVTANLVTAVHALLERMSQARISIPGQSILGQSLPGLSVPVNLVEMLRLNTWLSAAANLDALGAVLALTVALSVSLLAAAWLALSALFLAAAYNGLAAATGGISVELEHTPPS